MRILIAIFLLTTSVAAQDLQLKLVGSEIRVNEGGKSEAVFSIRNKSELAICILEDWRPGVGISGNITHPLPAMTPLSQKVIRADKGLFFGNA